MRIILLLWDFIPQNLICMGSEYFIIRKVAAASFPKRLKRTLARRERKHLGKKQKYGIYNRLDWVRNGGLFTSSALRMLSFTSAGSMEISGSILIMTNALLKNTLRSRKMLDKFYGFCSSSHVYFAAVYADCRPIYPHCQLGFIVSG